MKSIRSSRATRPLVATASAVSLCLLLAACGDNGGARNKPTTPADVEGIKFATARVRAFAEPPTSIGITQPVGKPIPGGKRIVMIGAGPGGIGTIIAHEAMSEAVEELDWELKFIQPKEPTPQLLQQALDQAIQLEPDAVVISATETAPIAGQLAKLKAKGIPVVSNNGPDPSGGPLVIQIAGLDALNDLAVAIADKTLADMGEPGIVGIVGLPGYRIISEYTEAYKKEIETRCPSCEIVEASIPVSSLGTTAGTAMANFTRASPDMKAMFVSYDAMGINLFSAAQAAGATLPRTYSLGTAPASIPALANGALTASAPLDQGEMGWRVVDALARIFTGQQESALKHDVMYPRPMLWSKSLNNVPEAPQGNAFPSIVKDYPEQYRKLWGK
ncbi:sugar ABC transporter substrate-binding protein [Streptomyces roseolus]